MLSINATKQKNGMVLGLHYSPIEVLSSNKKLSSLAFDGTTPAETLYPTTGLNPNGDNPSGFIGTVMTTDLSDYYPDVSDIYADGEEKYKTGLPLFNKYKKIININSSEVPPSQLLTISGIGDDQPMAIPKIWKLTDTTYLTIQVGTSGRYACVNTVNVDGTITMGTPIQLGTLTNVSNNADYDSMCEIDTNKFAYTYVSSSTTLAVYILTISGTTVAVGSVYNRTITTTSSYPRDIKITKVDTDKFLINWSSTSSKIDCVIGTVSGTTVTFGAEQTMFSGNYYYGWASVGMFSPTSGMAIAYHSANHGEKVGFTISGTVLTFGLVTTVGESSNHIRDQRIRYGNPTMSLLPNGNMWYFNGYYGYGSSYYFSMTGTTITKENETEGIFSNGYSGSSWSGGEQIDANNWIFTAYKTNTPVGNYMLYMKYNSGTGLVDVLKEVRLGPAANNDTNNDYKLAFGTFRNSTMQINLKSHYQTGLVTAWVSTLYSFDVFLNDNTTADFSLDNSDALWGVNGKSLSVDVEAKTLYLKFKNTSGRSATPSFNGLLVEVD